MDSISQMPEDIIPIIFGHFSTIFIVSTLCIVSKAFSDLSYTYLPSQLEPNFKTKKYISYNDMIDAQERQDIVRAVVEGHKCLEIESFRSQQAELTLNFRIALVLYKLGKKELALAEDCLPYLDTQHYVQAQCKIAAAIYEKEKNKSYLFALPATLENDFTRYEWLIIKTLFHGSDLSPSLCLDLISDWYFCKDGYTAIYETFILLRAFIQKVKDQASTKALEDKASTCLNTIDKTLDFMSSFC
jgi:hypothetical protein